MSFATAQFSTHLFPGDLEGKTDVRMRKARFFSCDAARVLNKDLRYKRERPS